MEVFNMSCAKKIFTPVALFGVRKAISAQFRFKATWFYHCQNRH